jgi:uncharacterized protein (DUF927 family)
VGVDALEALKDCLDKELYGKSAHHTCKKINDSLAKLYELIGYEYFIEGSFVLYHNYEIEWDLSVFISPLS